MFRPEGRATGRGRGLCARGSSTAAPVQPLLRQGQQAHPQLPGSNLERRTVFPRGPHTLSSSPHVPPSIGPAVPGLSGPWAQPRPVPPPHSGSWPTLSAASLYRTFYCVNITLLKRSLRRHTPAKGVRAYRRSAQNDEVFSHEIRGAGPHERQGPAAWRVLKPHTRVMHVTAQMQTARVCGFSGPGATSRVRHVM